MGVDLNSVIQVLARGVLYGLPGVALGLIMVPVVINARKPAVSTIAWILAMVALPYLGVLLYVVFGHQRIQRRVRRKRQARYAVASGLVDVKGAIKAMAFVFSGRSNAIASVTAPPRECPAIIGASTPFASRNSPIMRACTGSAASSSRSRRE